MLSRLPTEGAGTITDTKILSIADPRNMEGDPYEVAERACLQIAGLARVLSQQVELVNLMARNAELERALATTGDCTIAAATWPETGQALKLKTVQEDLAKIERDMAVLARAASYNPRRPPRVTA